MTTGLFPQSLTISFPQVVEIKDISLDCFKIRNLVVEKSIKSNPIDYELVHEKSFKNQNTELQHGELDFGRGIENRFSSKKNKIVNFEAAKSSNDCNFYFSEKLIENCQFRILALKCTPQWQRKVTWKSTITKEPIEMEMTWGEARSLKKSGRLKLILWIQNGATFKVASNNQGLLNLHITEMQRWQIIGLLKG
ncbi:Heat shock beta [Brachionus plicatilis]|uniref:Heat shock beta n=1 Tax=Brachionus plicatilis TaxID=10195 RepID=A0A3M7SJZ3_BRAPC|nr:Heat shock beta [Brachionus plicatilis]